MNTRSHILELTVTPRQVLEVAKAIFHTILFHRTTGKYSYSSHHSGTFSVGSVGLEDVDCLASAGFTYVRCASQELDQALTQEIEGFSSTLCQQSSRCRSGKLTLEFYEKKARWLLPAEMTNWEVWLLQVFLFEPESEEEWEKHQQQLAVQLREAVLYIADVVNKPDHVPGNPKAEELSNVFDTRFPTVQPYLHRVNFELSGEGVAGTVRKFLRDAFT